MTYQSAYGFDKNTFDKYATIQSDVQDMYLEEEEEMESDPFGFADAIEIEHLSDEEVDMVLAMFGDN
jgi:uncharacterized protein affecting Mg2+/Co2+ transport